MEAVGKLSTVKQVIFFHELTVPEKEASARKSKHSSSSNVCIKFYGQIRQRFSCFATILRFTEEYYIDC